MTDEEKVDAATAERMDTAEAEIFEAVKEQVAAFGNRLSDDGMAGGEVWSTIIAALSHVTGVIIGNSAINAETPDGDPARIRLADEYAGFADRNCRHVVAGILRECGIEAPAIQ